jgi:hypothetical protein
VKARGLQQLNVAREIFCIEALTILKAVAMSVNSAKVMMECKNGC